MICYGCGMAATPAWPPASTPRLFVDSELGPSCTTEIAGPAAHYLLHVMRLKLGDPIFLFDNRSGEWLARVEMTSKRSLHAAVEKQSRSLEQVPDLWLCFAPVKKARLDWIIEKATELGVARLQPVITERTIVDRVKADRLQAQMIEACEQCGRTSIPSLAEPVKLTQMIKDWPAERALLFADETGGTAMSRLKAPPPAAILIGPEGGFTDRERLMLLACPATLRLGLGPRILRAETAVVAAISQWMGDHGDWQGSIARVPE